MFNVFTEINWLSVSIAFLSYFMLGALWFMFLFSKQYEASLGRENDTRQSQSPLYIIGPAVCSFVITLTSAVLIYALNIDTFEDALLFAIIIGFGYLFTNTVMIAINPNIPRPLFYGLISGMYHFVGILIVSGILVAMK